MNKIINSIFLIPIIIIISSNSSLTQSINKDIIQDMKFRHIGPIGNRLTSVAGIPNRPLIDDHEVHSIGAIAVAPSDPMIIYVGTGESSIRSNVSIGNGVYKSEDGGDTWEHMGLKNSENILSREH